MFFSQQKTETSAFVGSKMTLSKRTEDGENWSGLCKKICLVGFCTVIAFENIDQQNLVCGPDTDHLFIGRPSPSFISSSTASPSFFHGTDFEKRQEYRSVAPVFWSTFFLNLWLYANYVTGRFWLVHFSCDFLTFSTFQSFQDFFGLILHSKTHTFFLFMTTMKFNRPIH